MIDVNIQIKYIEFGHVQEHCQNCYYLFIQCHIHECGMDVFDGFGQLCFSLRMSVEICIAFHSIGAKRCRLCGCTIENISAQ